jgi:UDP-glucose 4-epimerase
MKKRLLITGSNGFIGSYFIKKYSSKYNIETFSFLKDNIESLNCENIDVVLYLSGLVHQMNGASSEEYEKVNVDQTLELATKAKNQNVKHFIFMSTVKVYGEENYTKYTEDTLCNPQDDYGKSKLKAENELLKLEDKDFKVSIIRTPIVYGYGVKANIKNLISLVNNIPVLPFGNIQNRRSMVYIGNISHLIDSIVDKNVGGIFLASDDEPLSTSDFIYMIANSLNKKVYLLKLPFFGFLLKVLKPSLYKRLFGSLEVDNSKTKNILGYTNKYNAKDGIKYMIEGEQF